MPERRRLGTGGPAATVLRTAAAGRATFARVPSIAGPAENDRRWWRTLAHRNRAGPQPNAHAALAAVHDDDHAGRRRDQNRTSRLR